MVAVLECLHSFLSVLVAKQPLKIPLPIMSHVGFETDRRTATGSSGSGGGSGGGVPTSHLLHTAGGDWIRVQKAITRELQPVSLLGFLGPFASPMTYQKSCNAVLASSTDGNAPCDAEGTAYPLAVQKVSFFLKKPYD